MMLSPVFGFKTVIIDPGHGGSDKGGAHSKVYEKHLALDTCLRLERYLKKKGYNVVMTRRTDRKLSLSDRYNLANKYNSKNTIFVSVHVNKAWNRKATGIETFYYGKEGYKLAKAVQTKVIDKVGGYDRGLKFEKFKVIKYTRCPAILTEIGFVSNSLDRYKLRNGHYRESIAKAIADGIAQYD